MIRVSPSLTLLPPPAEVPSGRLRRTVALLKLVAAFRREDPVVLLGRLVENEARRFQGKGPSPPLPER